MDTPDPATTAQSLGRQSAFRRYWLARAVSSLGDAISLIALPLLILQATGSVGQMGIVSALGAGARLVAGLVAGTIADRYPRRPTLLISDLIRGLTTGALPLLWYTDHLAVQLIYLAAVVAGFLGSIFETLAATAVVELAGHDRLAEANGLVEGAEALMYVLGPGLAGVLAAGFGAAVAVGVDGLSFLLSAIVLLGITWLPRAESLGKHTIGTDLAAGYRALRGDPRLTRALLVTLVTAFASVAGVDVFIYRLRHDLHQPATIVGLVIGAACLGGVVAALSAVRLLAAWRPTAILIVVLGFTGCLRLALAFTTSVPFMVALAIGYTFGSSLTVIVATTVRGHTVPQTLLGRASAVWIALSQVATSLGAAMLTNLVPSLGTSGVFVLIGLSELALMIVIILPSAARDRSREGVLMEGRGDAALVPERHES
ncbi:MAG TPA: MFS transporter [Chloroflexota bacterium]|nr:MFS transporter [Chloroflexota bacterium]